MTDLMVAARSRRGRNSRPSTAAWTCNRFWIPPTAATACASIGYGPDEIVIGKIARLFHLKGQ